MIDSVYVLFIEEKESLEYAKDCIESCNFYGITPTPVYGVRGLSRKELQNLSGIKFGTDDTNMYANEYCATFGHLSIWSEIIRKNEPAIVLEHDMIIKHNFNDITVRDGEIIFLGPRVINRNDYNFPGDNIEYVPVNRFEGAHAYAITPNTAKYLTQCIINESKVRMPIDGILGIKNLYDLNLFLIDPPVAICEVGKRKSFAFGDVAYYNGQSLPGFKKGLTGLNKELPLNIPKFSVDWFSHNIPIWESVFNNLGINKLDKFSVLEIGCYEGKSSCWISDNLLKHPDSFMVCVDTFKGSIEHKDQDNLDSLYKTFMHNMLLSKNSHKVHVKIGDSKQVIPSYKDIKLKFNFIYIDGSHEKEDVIIDGMNCYDLLEDNGIIIFDDYGWSLDGTSYPVKEAIEVLETKLKLELVSSGWQRIYVKK